MADTVIEFSDVCKVFSSGFLKSKLKEILKNISLTVRQGEIFSLIGPNGAGKTTIIRVLLNFLKPTSGKITIFNKCNTDISLKNYIGYFPETSRYPFNLTVKQFLFYWAQFSGLSNYKAKLKIEELLKLVKLDDMKDSPIKKLSKGMIVRLSTAHSIINDPKLLILDEPSEGLDPLGRIEFRNILKNLKNNGITIFMNSHLLSEVEQLSDRVGIINKGKIVKIDSLKNIISLKHNICIEFECFSENIINKLNKLYNLSNNNGLWSMVVCNTEDVDQTIKTLSEYGVTIKRVDVTKSSLESEYLSLIETDI